MSKTDDFPEFDPTQLEMLREMPSLDFETKMGVGHQLLYFQAYLELCELVTGEKPSPTPPDEEEFAAKVLEYLNQNRERIHEAVCVKFGYCEKMKKYGYFAIPIPLLLVLAGFLADAILTCGFASTCWMTLKGILHKFCDC